MQRRVERREWNAGARYIAPNSIFNYQFSIDYLFQFQIPNSKFQILINF